MVAEAAPAIESLSARGACDRWRAHGRIPASHHAGGRSELLIQPSTISDFSGSGRSQLGHCMSAGALPSGDGARINFRPHLGQFEFEDAVAKEIPLPWHTLYRPAR